MTENIKISNISIIEHAGQTRQLPIIGKPCLNCGTTTYNKFVDGLMYCCSCKRFYALAEVDLDAKS